MMRLAVRLVAAGKSCVWLDPNTSESIKDLRASIVRDGPDALFIDDVDRFGETFSGLLSAIRRENPGLLVVAGIRTHRLQALQVVPSHEGFEIFELGGLTDEDSKALVKSLERGNRLGRLLDVPTHQRAGKIVGAWNGQLIVTLIAATSGRNFKEMIASECGQLRNEELDLYAVIAVAEASGTGNLSYDDALFAAGPANNLVLSAYRRLRDSKLVRESGRHVGSRHRVVAESALEHFRETGHLKRWVNDLIYLFAVKYDPAAMTQGRYGRLLIRFLNHDFLRSLVVDIDSVGWIYGQLEEVLAGEFHYWLQRGSFEVDTGNFELASVFLSQARIMRPEDILGNTAWHLLQLTKALRKPGDSHEATEGRGALEGLHRILLEQPKRSPHTYDVFLSLGRKWFSVAPMTRAEKVELRDRLFSHADVAERLYPTNERIRSSIDAVRRLKTVFV
jgi:hypothetical protein